MKNKFARPITTTLILATALVSFGCRQPLQGADMTNKPATRQTEKIDDVKPDKKPLDAVPVIIIDNGKTENPLKFKERKKGKHIEFK